MNNESNFMLPRPKTYLILKTGLIVITYQIDRDENPEKQPFMIFMHPTTLPP